MDDARGRPIGRVLVAVVLAVAVLVPVVMWRLTVEPDRLTVGTGVVAVLLVIGSIALPALLFSRWQSADP
ncbi:hypothetical protein [Natrarchaeobius oligotrophus]|uniref:Uncharacterized protein n=1 Tax=Natrarchaeobius chitinivorans TaxID=1679083 RepID=A0A3N6PNN0_NATCH|nr:hypothetical protein [Natrarchaeobius chitinivorans]RQH03290.1 hypothetical protein EA472_01530 [Natrarchaeobius chitinivorans]